MIDKIAVEQFINGLPQELRIWVASHDPKKPTDVAELIESYDSAHARGGTEKAKFTTPRPASTRDGSTQGRKDSQKKPLSEVVCFKCNKKGHFARSCTERGLRVREECETIRFFGEGQVNGKSVKRIQLDSGASRTIVNRNLIAGEDIGEESIRVTFGNGTAGEYPLATVKVKFDGEEYTVKAAVVENLAEEVLLGRDVPLHRHIVKRLPKEEQVELIKQLAEDNHMCVQEGTALAVTTRAQKKSDQTENDAGEKTPEETRDETLDCLREKTVMLDQLVGETPEDVYETSLENAGREALDDTGEKSNLALKEFDFEDDLFEPSSSKLCKTRAEKREDSRQWNHMKDISGTMELKVEQEKDPDIQKWVVSPCNQIQITSSVLEYT